MEFTQITLLYEQKKASNAIFNNDSHREHDVQRPQMTSNGLKTTKSNTKSKKKNKNILKVGSIQEYIEINDHYFDEVLDNNNS